MRSWSSIVATLALSVAFLAAAATGDAVELLPGPDSVSGWTLKEEPRTYRPDDLYEYIDGNADLFLSYGFVRVAVGDYVPRDGSEGWIIVDVYDLGAPLHAFGVYRAERAEGVDALDVGTEGYASDGMLAFWKGQYYVKVLMIDGEAADTAQLLAEKTVGGICGVADMPAELARLPADRRIPDSERYVKTSALGHRFLAEVLSADYSLSEKTATLHVADLGDSAKAAEALLNLSEFEVGSGAAVEDVLDVGVEAFGTRDPYYGEMVVGRVGQYVAIALSEEAGRDSLAELAGGALSALPDETEKEC
jgi:hypothetical protein